MTGSKTADYLIFAVTALMLLIANIMLVYDVLTVEITLLIVLVWYVSISVLDVWYSKDRSELCRNSVTNSIL